MGFALKKLSWILVSREEKIISISQLRYKLFTKEMCWGTLGHPVQEKLRPKTKNARGLFFLVDPVGTTRIKLSSS